MARKKEYYRDIAVSPIHYGGGNGGSITANNVIWNTAQATTWNGTIQYYTGGGNGNYQIAIDPVKPKSKFGDDFDWLKKRVDEYINDFDRMAA